jgi:hypothetical protein
MIKGLEKIQEFFQSELLSDANCAELWHFDSKLYWWLMCDIQQQSLYVAADFQRPMRMNPLLEITVSHFSYMVISELHQGEPAGENSITLNFCREGYELYEPGSIALRLVKTSCGLISLAAGVGDAYAAGEHDA